MNDCMRSACFLQSDRSGRSDDDLKREHMEKLVREELERWDSEASMNRGASPSGSRANTARSSRGMPSAQGTRSPSRNSQASGSSGSVRPVR